MVRLEEQPKPWRLALARRRVKPPVALMLLVAFVIGFVAPYAVAAYPLTVIIPLMWVWSLSRGVAGLVLVCYYTGATWVAVPGWQSYSDLDGMGTLATGGVWFVCVLLASLPWVLLYRSDNRWLMVRIVALFGVTVLPPIGLIQLANPWTGPALILPALGWVSVALGLVIIRYVATHPRAIVLVFACLTFTAVYGTKARSPADWQAHHTTIPHGGFEALQAPTFNALRDAGRIARQDEPAVLLLGESTMGASTRAAKMGLGSLGETTVLLGAHDHTSTPARSALAVVNEKQSAIVYQQRVPVPFAGKLWPKWHSPIVMINDRAIAPLICYEGVSSWATLSALALQPGVVAVLANGSWTMHSDRLEQALHAHMGAWAAVFDVPYLVAMNKKAKGAP